MSPLLQRAPAMEELVLVAVAAAWKQVLQWLHVQQLHLPTLHVKWVVLQQGSPHQPSRPLAWRTSLLSELPAWHLQLLVAADWAVEKVANQG